MTGKLRTAVEAIHALVGEDVGYTFGRRAAGEHAGQLHVKYIPIGGPIGPAARTAEKVVPGPAGKITPGPNATLKQPGVDTRQSECAQREPRLLAICIAGNGEDEGADIDAAEALLERVIVAAKQMYGEDVIETEGESSERWLVQEDEKAAYGVAGEAVMLTLAFRFPVIRQVKKVLRLGGHAHTCKLDDTLENDTPAP